MKSILKKKRSTEAEYLGLDSTQNVLNYEAAQTYFGPPGMKHKPKASREEMDEAHQKFFGPSETKPQVEALDDEAIIMAKLAKLKQVDSSSEEMTPEQPTLVPPSPADHPILEAPVDPVFEYIQEQREEEIESRPR